jgi:hypothetical protein
MFTGFWLFARFASCLFTLFNWARYGLLYIVDLI